MEIVKGSLPSRNSLWASFAEEKSHDAVVGGRNWILMVELFEICVFWRVVGLFYTMTPKTIGRNC